MSIVITAIRDGWAQERISDSKEDALARASILWDSGRFESISVYAGTCPLFFRRHKHLTSVKRFAF